MEVTLIYCLLFRQRECQITRNVTGNPFLLEIDGQHMSRVPCRDENFDFDDNDPFIY
jgi:hypothetical protein